MRDALLVRGVERIANLHRVLQCLVERQRPLEWSPLDVLHNQVVGTHVVELADVRMIKGAYGFGFPLKPLTELGLGNLDGHDAIKARVTSLVDIAHSARTDWRKDFVGAEFFARR